MILDTAATTRIPRRSPMWTPTTLLPAARDAWGQHQREALGQGHAAFELGWDFARHGLSSAVGLEDNAEFNDGIRAGCRHWPQRWEQSRHVRKWLLLRAGALVRGVPISAHVTPEYLEAIDVQVCPITRVALTHASGSNTDASVDRVDNARGYEPENLAVISVLANGAKAGQCAADMLKIVAGLAAEEPSAVHQGLDAKQWARLATMTAFGEHFADPVAVDHWPLVVLPAPHMAVRDAAWSREFEWTMRGLDRVAAPESAPAEFARFAVELKAAVAGMRATCPSSTPAQALEDAWTAQAVNLSWLELARALRAAEGST
jgi:hypothetical protein